MLGGKYFSDHIVLVWLGTPDNEPTTILTGRSAAYPISKDIQLTLGLSFKNQRRL